LASDLILAFLGGLQLRGWLQRFAGPRDCKLPKILRITQNATRIPVMKRAMPLAMPLLFLALGAFAQTGKQPKPLTNPDALGMSGAGMPVATSQQVVTSFVRDLRGAAAQGSGPAFGLAVGSFPVTEAAGKTVRFSAWIKTENVRDGYAGLWWRVDGPGQGTDRPVLAFDNSQARFIDGKPDAHSGTMRGATGTTPWTLYEFELPVGKTASNINFGVLFSGTGTAWVDAMKVELDGEPYSNPQFDFDFESPTVKGFSNGCGGSAVCTGYKYKVGIDNAVSYSGHQSLKMQFVGDGASQ
jgi:hypothetical protein